MSHPISDRLLASARKGSSFRTMDAFLIRGGQRLSGSVTVSGAKNSALPILAVSLMTADPCRFHNVPAIRDIQTQIKILNTLGVETACDPIVAWVALEVVLKLRRLSVEALRDRALAVEEVATDRIAVRGLGDPVTVAVRREPTYVVAWAAS